MRRHLTWRRFFESRLFFVVGIGFLLLLSINLTRSQLKDRAIRNELANLGAEVDTLEKEHEAQEALLSLLQTPEFLEKEARRSLGYSRPGEQVVVIEKREGECKMDNEKCTDGEEARVLSNPRKWWVYFFGEI